MFIWYHLGDTDTARINCVFRTNMILASSTYVLDISFFLFDRDRKLQKLLLTLLGCPTFSNASFAIFLMEIRRFLRKFVMRYRLIRSRCISERASFFKYSRLVCMGSLMWCALYGMKLLIPHPYNLFLQQSITLSFHQPIRLHP